MGKEVEYSVRYSPSVLAKDVPALDTFWRNEIKIAITGKLASHPEVYGTPLRQTLKGLWKLRVGAYRIIYRIESKTIQIVIIGHRSQVYREVAKRLGL
ncbi:MAG: type II toxin-antitoxin system RelE/ParE family toxin [Minisyncoccia bacterium]